MISLPLAKLSFAHDAYVREQTSQWKHETNNLVCVIDSYQAGGSNFQLLKIVQGTQIREQIELERLILESQDLTRDMQQRGIELKGEQLPISAIVRCPLLAIRWQLPDQKIRRIQIRFKSDEDYDIVYNRLHRLGLRMMPPQNQSRDRGVRPLTPVSNELMNQGVPTSPSTYSTPSFGVKDHSSHLLDSPSSGDADRDLKNYAMQSSDNRRVALDNFVLNSLDSPEFLTLVEDMETNWARIGLGTW
ncbi:hypothetical protein E8E13_000756 [Curvularia kusanoi]|uniref:Uncharacterized protein n=1 Tax=Curvularia kusanoi TaxID=90978 RepID=A0A9P4TJL4_CURKU|nr:hypothetical protein E8E13_000756 [Curvularia kusanoi]